MLDTDVPPGSCVHVMAPAAVRAAPPPPPLGRRGALASMHTTSRGDCSTGRYQLVLGSHLLLPSWRRHVLMLPAWGSNIPAPKQGVGPAPVWQGRWCASSCRTGGALQVLYSGWWRLHGCGAPSGVQQGMCAVQAAAAGGSRLQAAHHLVS